MNTHEILSSILLNSELSIGTIIQIAGFSIAILSIAVTVGYFKGRFEGVERDLNEMKGEKKKELTIQTERNNEYHTRLMRLEAGQLSMSDMLKELRSDVKQLLSRS